MRVLGVEIKNDVSPIVSNIFCSVGERLAMMNSFYGDVDFIIMDVPLVEDLIWGKYSERLSTAIMETFTSFENLNVMLFSHFSDDGKIKDFLSTWRTDYFNLNNTISDYRRLIDISKLRHKDLLPRKDGVLSVRNVMELLTMCAIRNGFKLLNPTSNKDA